ncbi:hypothetical protein PIB30_011609 [Stylosanthes scabra]|uniref:Uncharacterized protein n=1 Tax=Stylosanthes scabra TaxID=79078 RepID=A0ABU6V870_9FABA|nr:hypothetical protein [Stylosanthes scabra]
MANIPSSLSLQLSNAFPLPSSKFSPKPHLLLRNHHRFLLFSTRAQSDSDESQPDSDPPAAPDDGDDFEDRINQLRVRYRSGTGKKAEARKGRKSNKKGSSSGSGVFLPPIPLKEPVSSGLKVDFGFSEYSERLNGRIAILGLTALLLVELATGKGVINYHTPGIVLIQIYFVAAVSALYVKYEKEKISVWPDSSANK